MGLKRISGDDFLRWLADATQREADGDSGEWAANIWDRAKQRMAKAADEGAESSYWYEPRDGDERYEPLPELDELLDDGSNDE